MTLRMSFVAKLLVLRICSFTVFTSRGHWRVRNTINDSVIGTLFLGISVSQLNTKSENDSYALQGNIL